MEHKRARTLAALESFVNAQKALLARTHADIARLKNLKQDALAHPDYFLSNAEQLLDENAFSLNDALLRPPHGIDWAVYDKHDPRALQNLNIDLQNRRDQKIKPSSHQRSELSPLQKLVKDARRTTIDPILLMYEGMSEPEPESDDELDPEDLRREVEKAKLRELKKRKIHCGELSLPSSQGQLGVYIRHDVEDESPEVDITLDEDDALGPSSSIPLAMNTDALHTTKSTYALARKRKPTAKAQNSKTDYPPVSLPKKRKPKSLPLPAPEPEPHGSSFEPEETMPPIPTHFQFVTSRGKLKPKPETYKQQWTMSEQHLLEQLLEQIPDGEKNRWQKISRAMDGKRTPRQVASRVQKYFAKLKRFGV